MKCNFREITRKINLIKIPSFIQWMVIVSALLILSYVSYHNVISESPKGIHTWSQSDHYAIALGFAENDLNLFKPQSYLLNPPIITPNVDSLQGITRVDFPLYHYIVGASMKVTNCEAPFVQRFISLLIGLIGLIFLFKLVKQYTQFFWSAGLLTVFVFCLPVYMYYQCNFLPSVPGIALCFIGYYFYFNYLDEKKGIKYFIVGILFFTLAVLFRLPLGVALVAVCCQQVLNYILNRKIIWKEIIIMCVAFLLLVSYYIYNHFVGIKYGSIFLAEILPASSWEEFKTMLTQIREVQENHQLNDPVKIFVYVVCLNFIACAVYSWIKKQPLSKFQKQLLLQAAITFVGGCFYFFLMIKQFVYHDYYFIDSLYIGFILFLFFFFTFINWKWNGINIFLKLLLLVGLCFIFPKSLHQKDKFLIPESYDLDYYLDQNVADIQYLLDKNHIGKDKKIYIMDDKLQANMAFCRLKRRGFCWDGYERARKWIEKADYIFSSGQSLENSIFKNDFTLKYELSVVDQYATMVMFERNIDITTESVPNDASAQMYDLNFDTRPATFWRIQDDVIILNDSMQYVAHVIPDREFTSTLNFPAKELKPPASFKDMFVELDIMPLQTDMKTTLVIVQNRNDSTLIYKSFDIGDKKQGEWSKVNYLLNFSGINLNTDVFNVYIWNHYKSEFYYDNLKVIFY